MRENGIGINRGNPFLKKGDLPGPLRGNDAGTFLKKGPAPQKLLNGKVLGQDFLSEGSL